MLRQKKFVTILVFAISAIFFCTAVHASEEQWPTKPITIITPYNAGGGTDRLSRTLAPYLQDELGVPVNVENRPGGAGIVGTQKHLKAGPDDGSEFLFQLQPYVSAGMLRGANYTLEDIAFIGNVYRAPQAIWARADSDWKTMEDLLKSLKKENLSYSYIPGSYMVLGPLFLQGIFNPSGKDVGVPYDGAGPARSAFLGEHVDYICSDLYSTAATVGDDAKPLAVFAKERDKKFPAVPTVNEVLDQMGVDEQVPELANIYFAIVRKEFPAKYPERYAKLLRAFEACMENPELIETYEKTNVYTTYLPPYDLKELVYTYDQLIQKFKKYWVD